MDLGQSPFFSALRTRLDQLGARQRLVAENLANVATPDFTPRDLDTSRFQAALAAQAARGEHGRLALSRTEPGHLPSVKPAMASARVHAAPDTETTIDGNSVVLEDQVLKASETRAAFELHLALYQKGLSMLRLAARGPR